MGIVIGNIAGKIHTTDVADKFSGKVIAGVFCNLIHPIGVFLSRQTKPRISVFQDFSGFIAQIYFLRAELTQRSAGDHGFFHARINSHEVQRAAQSFV